MKVKSYILEYYFSIIAFVLVCGVLSSIYSIGYNENSRSSGNVVFQATSLSVYIVGLYFILKYCKTSFFKSFTTQWPLTILLLWCFFSCLWSVEPLTSFRRVLALILSSVFCFYLVSRFNIFYLLKILSYSFFFAILATFFVVLLLPNIGVHSIDSHAGSWKGLAGHKNYLGKYMAIGVIYFYYLVFISPYKSQLNKFLLLGCCFLLLMTTSKTALLSTCVGVFFLYYTRFTITGRFYESQPCLTGFVRHTFSVILLVTLVSLAFFFVEYVLSSIGRDLTFTGRVKIWSYALLKSWDNFWLGAGYRTFWIDSLTGDFFVYNPYWGNSDGTGKVTANGHNGFIDVYAELGMIGLILYTVFILSFVKRILSPKYEIFYPNRLNCEPFSGFKSLKIFLGGLLGFYLVYCITEQPTLKQSDMLWMFLTIFYFCLKKREFTFYKNSL